MSKVALITRITGQDGSYLAELLLNKGYETTQYDLKNGLIETKAYHANCLEKYLR